jgi:hypothetical protein
MNTAPQGEGPSQNRPPQAIPQLEAAPTLGQLQFVAPGAERTHRIEGLLCSIDYHTGAENGVEIVEDAFVRVKNPFGSGDNVYSLLAPSTALRTELLRVLSAGASAGLAADIMLRPLEEVVRTGGSSWISIFHPSLISRFDIPPSTVMLPDFSEFAANPQGLRPNFLCARVTNGLYERCTSEINTEESRLLVSFFRTESHAPPVLQRQIDLHLAQESGPAREASQTINVNVLCRVSQDVMECFQSAGCEAGIDRMEEFYEAFLRKGKVSPDATVDARLRFGRVRPDSIDVAYAYRSGAKLSVEIGDEVALLRIDSSALPEASTYLAVIDRVRGALGFSDWLARRDALVDVARRLCTDSGSLQMQAIDDLRALSTNMLLFRAPVVALLGEKSAQELLVLRQEHGLTVRTFGGKSSRDVQRICDGVESLVLSLPHRPLDGRNLASFRSVRALFRPDGSLEVRLQNELGINLFALICSATVAQEGGRGSVVERLARAMLAQDQAVSRYPVHEALDFLTSVHPGESVLHVGDPLDPRQIVPERDDSFGHVAFALAETLARASLGLSRGHGRHCVSMQSNGVAQLVLRYDGAPYELHVTVAGVTISNFALLPNESPPAVQQKVVVRSYEFPTNLSFDVDGEDEQVPAEAALVYAVLTAFSAYGVAHVGLNPRPERIEDTECFALLDRAVRGRLT